MAGLKANTEDVMSEGLKIDLTPGQLNLIAQRYGVSGTNPLLDVGSRDGQWISKLRERGVAAVGLEERHLTTATPSDTFTIGSPAANLPGATHSYQCVLFRGTSLIEAEAFHPELMIALANMGSMLKSNGRLVIPVPSNNEAVVTRWKSMLEQYPGRVTIRQHSTGLMGYLTLAFLFGGMHSVTVVELNVQNQNISRLEWHKAAREAVMRRLKQQAEAA